MGKLIIDRLLTLLEVKSIVTIMLCYTFCTMTAEGRVEADKFIMIFSVVISFFFGVKAANVKKGNEK